MKLVSWNCRGLGSAQKVKSLKDLIIFENPTILLIQETKIEEEYMLSIGNRTWRESLGIAGNSRGASGGIGTFWLDSAFELMNSLILQNVVVTTLKHKAFGHLLNIFNIYAPVIYNEKKIFYDTLV